MDKKYFILGLGMIGASYAKILSSLGYAVYGYDILKEANEKAVSLGYIKAYGKEYIKGSDLVILTLYPKDNYEFIKTNLNYFDDVKLVTDVSGVKKDLITKISNILPKGIEYLSHHPMAGSEKSGIDAASSDVFKDSNFLIVTNNKPKEESLKTLIKLKNDLGFNKLSIISEDVHDMMISFTSQLPHMLAVALVNSDTFLETKDFSGDSYKDLTRIANINEELWTELFLSNQDNLIMQIERFQEELKDLLEILKKDDKDSLKKRLKVAKEKRRSYD